MKPSDLYVGVVDLFAIMLPGTVLTAFLVAALDLPQVLVSATLLLVARKLWGELGLDKTVSRLVVGEPAMASGLLSVHSCCA